jgi:hypothetical protein
LFTYIFNDSLSKANATSLYQISSAECILTRDLNGNVEVINPMRTPALPDRDNLSKLIDEIVSNLPRDEHRTYARSKALVFERVYAGDDPASLFEAPSSLFEFGESAIEIFKSVGILLGTVKTATDLFSLYRKSKAPSGVEERLKSVKEEWTKELVNVGIPADQAAKIAEQFSGRLLDVIA